MARKFAATVAFFLLGVATGVVGITFAGAGAPSGPPGEEGSRAAPAPGPIVRSGIIGGPPAAGITVSEGFVYVLLGNTVYKLDASDLKIVSQKALVEPGPRETLPLNPSPR